ncbi:uncharacterized protein LOC120272471 [Dioscorea cayenensis subsp. rotundata]|uniref:Uncharacterized protein LOC120272471 n=1 Tax=Dioscorea cayennensis subsp. rotundata TaxID=55577 RepID=A0AB40C5Z0_DIOCR|nr:uncharacterized protein LOC120272471 [Dioscorea cayenensis subsp. rotundata]
MEFQRFGPPPFEGTTNPDEVEVWVEQMEKAFAVMKCIKEEKLRFGVYMLKGSANYWDKMVQFEKKFINLTQGSMTVDEYEMEFDRLSRYAPKLVDDDQSRSDTKDQNRRFLKKRDRSFDSQRNHQLGSEGKPRLEARQSESQTVNGPPTQWSRGFATVPPHSGQRCATYEGSHATADCRRNTGACFKCGSLEHRIAGCLQRFSGAQRTSSVQDSRQVSAPKP